MGAGAAKASHQEKARQKQNRSRGSRTRPSTLEPSQSGRPPSGHSRLNNNVPATLDSDNMPCALCSVNFTILKRKLFCDECKRPHCSTCMPKDSMNNTGAITFSTNKRRCPNCRMLVSGQFTRNDLNVRFNIRDLKAFLERRSINTSHCKERNDLVELVLQHSNSSTHFREQREHEQHLNTLQERQREYEQDLNSPAATVTQNISDPTPTHSMHNATSNQQQTMPTMTGDTPTASPSVDTPPSSSNQSESVFQHTIPADRDTEALRNRQQQEMRNAEMRLQDELQTEEAQTPISKNMTHINDIETLQKLEGLTNRQLKEILASSFVDYKGCVERGELLDRVTQLWRDKQRLAEKGPIDDQPESEVCKICMDAVIDCVFLYCGHMVTCAECGHKLAECPVCRVNIVRVMRTFKA